MKKLLLISLLLITSSIILGQTAYIEVKGEPDLSVYLNGKYKGKTTAEFNGLIIENVSAGSNLIKIEKEGYTPFEESITIKPSEVFAYKVKPFAKHTVLVSEEGNTGETDKKATVRTGKLIIQSVPIEIKITMPDIEGMTNTAKTKDKWQADEIPAGNYKITFTYNQKVITKTIEVIGSETTSLFVNMLSGDFKTSNTYDERTKGEREEYLKYRDVSNFIDSICTKYKYKSGLSKTEFIEFNPDASRFMNSSIYDKYGRVYSNTRFGDNINDYVPGINCLNFGYDGMSEAYSNFLICGKRKGAEVDENFKKIETLIKSKIPKEFITIENSSNKKYSNISIKIQYPKGKEKIVFSSVLESNHKDGYLDLTIRKNYYGNPN